MKTNKIAFTGGGHIMSGIIKKRPIPRLTLCPKLGIEPNLKPNNMNRLKDLKKKLPKK